MDVLTYILSKKYTDEAILKSINGTIFEAKVVETLPEEGVNGIVYLVPAGQTKKLKNIYNEFIWVASTSSFEQIGSTELDLSDYYNKSAVDALLAGKLETKQDQLVDGLNIKTINGISLLGTGDLDIAVKGPQGEPGIDGLTPHIGSNNNWFIGETDTGVSAVGAKGDTGETGPIGPKGEDGLTTTIKVGETLYTHNDGVISLPEFLTEDSLEDYATEQYVIEAIANQVPVENLASKSEVLEVKTTLEDTILPKVEKVDEIVTVVETLKTTAATQEWVKEQGYLTEESEIYKVDFNAPSYEQAFEAYKAGKILILVNAAPDIESYAVMNYATERYITFTKFLTSRSEAYGSFNTYYLSPSNTWEVSKEVKLNKVEANPNEGSVGELTKVRIGKEVYNIPQAPSLEGIATEDYVREAILAAKRETQKYELMYNSAKSLIEYRDKEIRFLSKEDYKLQTVGENGNQNMYYLQFRAYAPEKAVYFKEGDSEIISDETFYNFADTKFAGIDQYGRKYSSCWLAIAKTDDNGQTWNYFGNSSTIEHCIGWYYTVEWYDENKELISTDRIRINLTNENCHNSLIPEAIIAYINKRLEVDNQLESETYSTKAETNTIVKETVIKTVTSDDVLAEEENITDLFS